MKFRRAGRGHSIFLIHGFLGGAGVWLKQQIDLQHAFDTIAVDLPGFAGSPIGSGPRTMPAFAAEVVRAADSLGLQQFSLVGWSFGGMIAQQVAFDNPDRVKHLVLTGTAALGELPKRFETWSQTLERINSEGVPSVFDRTVRTWFVSGERDPFFMTCRTACNGATEDACLGAISAMQPWNVVDRLQTLDKPTLVVVGDRDRSTTIDESLVLFKGLPRSELCVMPGCAHGAHMEKPNIFNRVVADFLDATSA